MDGLYPIIRRVRRPLIIADDDAGPPPAPPPVVPAVGTERPVSYGASVSLARKGKHGTAEKTEH